MNTAAIAYTQARTPLPQPPHDRVASRRVERAMDLLRAHLLERAANDQWDEGDVHEFAQAIVTCLRQSGDIPAAPPRSRDARLSRAQLRAAFTFINTNLDEKLVWESVARAVGLPTFSFGRGFKLTTGLTPHQYIIRCRIRRAMRLLGGSEQSIADIALEVGCSCQSHFTTLFRKYTGTTPGAFRAGARRALPKIAVSTETRRPQGEAMPRCAPA